MNSSNHLHDLPSGVPIFIGRQEFIVEYAAGKNVLHLGCVDEGLTEQKYRAGMLLHDRLQRVAKTLYGVDIDKAGLDWMRAHGCSNLIHADIENVASIPEIAQVEFDLILLPEVLEHLNNPGRFLASVRPLFRPQTELIITVPNSSGLTHLIPLYMGKEHVHPDHNYWFSYHTLKGLVGKHGYEVSETAVYCQYNFRRSILGHLRKKIIGVAVHAPVVGPSPGDLQPPVRGKSRKIRVGAWIRVTLTTLIYRFFLKRNPFFADGLIMTIRPVNKPKD
ncbi:MAG: methyltransferase domain-containing protein [Chloroflexota bacterium]|nr:MAG: methyltransferase domain-containing protein [Chloroflexota bacterium]